MKYGFVKMGIITPKIEVGAPRTNIMEMLDVLNNVNSQFAVFPELSLTGSTCGDLFFQDDLIGEVIETLTYFLTVNPFDGITIIGAPVSYLDRLYNCAIVIKKDKILGIVPKTYLPNNLDGYEKRYFESGFEINTKIDFIQSNVPFGNIIFEDKLLNLRFGVEIGDDMLAPISPASVYSANGANVIINIAAFSATLSKIDMIRNAAIEQSRKNSVSYVMAQMGASESTSSGVYLGNDIVCICGNVVKEDNNVSLDTKIVYADIDIKEINFRRKKDSNLKDAAKFYKKDLVNVCFNLDLVEINFSDEFNQTPFVPKTDFNDVFNKISTIQEYALIKRLAHLNTRSVVIGISGGLDSTLALLVAHQAFLKLNWDPRGIIAVTMPGLGTSARTKNNAYKLMQGLGVTVKELDINNAVMDHFRIIEHDPNNKDITYENAQARMRTLILMDLANKYNGFVLGTGDLSELALGWCTYNGDQMSMYGINAGIPKTLVLFMVYNYAMNKYENIAETLIDICETPISPELVQGQKTEDNVGKYEINDFILYRFGVCGDGEEKIFYLLKRVFGLSEEEATKYVSNFFRRFYAQQYKRQALPDGPKVVDIALSANGDFRMPCDVKRG